MSSSFRNAARFAALALVLASATATFQDGRVFTRAVAKSFLQRNS